jgi:hypothetical protein
MDLNYALRILAENIWNKGETQEFASGCLIPSDYVENPKTYNIASDVLAKLGYTHFERLWNIKGKTVLLKFYSGDAFGAAIITKEDFKKEYIVEV